MLVDQDMKKDVLQILKAFKDYVNSDIRIWRGN